MKRYAFLLSVLMLVSPAAYAEEKSGLSQFLDGLKAKLERLVPQKRLSAVTATGGVRGAEVETSDVYWKGEAKPIEPAELDAFRKALALAQEGKKTEAAAAFADFTKTYPESALRKDADQALQLLQAR